MPDADRHEWAAGIHAALFSLAVILGSIAWGNRFALALILIAQALAYLGRLYLIFPANKRPVVAIIVMTYASDIAAALSALVLLLGRIG